MRYGAGGPAFAIASGAAGSRARRARLGGGGQYSDTIACISVAMRASWPAAVKLSEAPFEVLIAT
jgi:hypothetical protein